MSDRWYESATPDRSLTQGDIILACPLIRFRDEPVERTDGDALGQLADCFEKDVVVLTQACDLEQAKVASVVLCPAAPLSEYKVQWEESVTQRGQNPTARSWKAYCDNIASGYVWNLSLLNSGEGGPVRTEVRVVDFHEVYTLPRTFLESYMRESGALRLRLLPPYREHLSQAFARFFMRVGLPVPIERVWSE